MDCSETELRQRQRAGDMSHLNVSLYKSALMEELCFGQLKSAVSGAHIHTNTHSCFNEKMTEDSLRPSVHMDCWVGVMWWNQTALYYYIRRSKVFMMSTLQTPDLHTEIEVFLVGWVALLTACLVFVNVLLLLSMSKSLHTGPVKCPTSVVF